MNVDEKPFIAVIGGGIGGLGFALAMQLKGYEVTVFEKDESFNSRRQGYGLTIQQGSRALKLLGLKDQVLDVDTPSSSHYIFHSDGSIAGFFGRAFSPQGISHKRNNFNLHIPRQTLRQFIHDKLDKTCIRWGYKLKHMAQRKGKTLLEFENGSNVFADIVIGADGIFSFVRHSLVDDEKDCLKYLGVIVVLGICDLDHILLKERIIQSVDGSTRLFAMPFTCEQTMWQLSFPVKSQEEALEVSKDFDRLKSLCLEKLKNWHQPIEEMLRSTPKHLWMATPVFDRDPLPIQPLVGVDRPLVTLLGDAAHPMSPFKGQGANQALLDALDLSHSLIEGWKSSTPSKEILDTFEISMLERSRAKVLGSRDRVSLLHSDVVQSEENAALRGVEIEILCKLKDNLIGAYPDCFEVLDQLVAEHL